MIFLALVGPHPHELRPRAFARGRPQALIRHEHVDAAEVLVVEPVPRCPGMIAQGGTGGRLCRKEFDL
jgi:hypothetical protein